MGVSVIEEIITYGPEICKALICCAGGISELAKCFEDIAENIRSTLKFIDEVEGGVIELRGNALECRTLLSKAYNCASNFMDRVEKCFRYGNLSQEEKEDIKENVEKGDFMKVNSYFDQLRRFFKQCDKCYKKFEGFNTLANKSCTKSIEMCEQKRKGSSGGTTQSAGKFIMGLGITAATTAAVGGVAVVAGLFTFGIGTPIVLGLSVAGSAVGAATAIAGNAIKNIGDHYAQLEKEFRKINDNFDRMRNLAERLDADMHKVRELLAKMDMNNENTINAPQKDLNRFNKMFENLLEDFKNDGETIKETQKNMNMSKKAVDNIMC